MPSWPQKDAARERKGRKVGGKWRKKANFAASFNDTMTMKTHIAACGSRHASVLRHFAAILALASATTATAQTPGWHKLYSDSLRGADITAAREFAASQGLKPAPVVVAILDSGLDTLSTAVSGSLWTNAGEIPANGLDDDHNGYADDVHGWNFLGTRDGSFNMTSAGTEEYREFKRLYPKYKHLQGRPAPADYGEYDYYLRMRKKAGIVGYLRFYGFAQQKDSALNLMDSIIRAQPSVGYDTLTVGGMTRLKPADERWDTLAQYILADLLRTPGDKPWATFRREQKDALDLMAQRIDGIEHAKDKRLLMGDDMDDEADTHYGNATLTIDGCDHGTFVASVIAGRWPADPRYSGICPEARLMIVRVSPDGDEYDKDVASGIRYAVDNGARIINISLGKYTSPHAGMVNDALDYARRKDVLVVAAAGNNHLNIDTVAYFPSSRGLHGEGLDNYLRVGATAPDGSLSSISNYGSRTVDIYAPGEAIAGIFPTDKPAEANGTSVAAPVVTGIAAMMRACFPKMKASRVKQILMSTARPMPSLPSVSGGIVDALAAMRMAAGK